MGLWHSSGDSWLSGDVPVEQQCLIDMALYFSDFGPDERRATLYDNLLSSMMRGDALEKAVFCTLNYECLFERCARRHGYDVSYRRPRETASVLLLKPHGSCNFMTPSGFIQRNVTMVNVGTYYDGPLEFVDPGSIRSRYAESGPAIPPAMSLFAPGKESPVAPTFARETRGEWARAIASSDVAVVIGAQPNMADGHVWEPIIEHAPAVWYVGGHGGDFPAFEARLEDRLESLGDRFEEASRELERRIRSK